MVATPPPCRPSNSIAHCAYRSQNDTSSSHAASSIAAAQLTPSRAGAVAASNTSNGTT